MSKVLVMRTCNADMSSKYNPNFLWPKSGYVKCPDWDPKSEYGDGLHGCLEGEGNGGLLDFSPDAIWMVLEVESDQIVDLDCKVKFPECNVILIGTREEVTGYMVEKCPGKAVIGATVHVGDNKSVVVGDFGTAIVGYNGTSFAGFRGTATAGNCGTATAGNYGTATADNDGTSFAGFHGTATAGDNGTATAGFHGTAIVGDNGTATAGNEGNATAGNNGTAIVGFRGTATVGNDGTAIAGYCGTATAGKNGNICIKWRDEENGCYRLSMAFIDGVEYLPGVPYVCGENRKILRA